MKLSTRLALAAVLAFAPTLAQAQTTAAVLPNASVPLTTGHCMASQAPNQLVDSGVLCANNSITLKDTHSNGMLLIPSYPSTHDPAIVINQGRLRLTRQSVFGSGTSGTDASDVLFARTADYSGGTGGFVNGALACMDTVSAGVKAYEWCGTFIADNSSTAADNSNVLATYSQGIKRSTGPTWAAVAELIDYLANPTTPSVTEEFDNVATGGDSNNMRVGLDVFGKSRDGNPATVFAGMRIIADSNTTVANGLRYQGAFGLGLDLSNGTYSAAALKLGSGQSICMDSSCQNGMSATPGSGVSIVGDSLSVGNFVAGTIWKTDGSGNTTQKGEVNLASSKRVCFDGTCQNNLSGAPGSGATFVADSLQLSNFVGGGVVFTVDGNGNIKAKNGAKLALDGTSGSYLTYDGGTGQYRIANAINGTVFSVDGVGAGVLRAGLTATTGSFSGAVSAASFSGTTNGQHNGNVCVDGSGCGIRVGNSGSSMTLTAGSGSATVTNGSIGVPSGGTYGVGFSVGVSCSGAPTASFQSVGGIVTHC